MTAGMEIKQAGEPQRQHRVGFPDLIPLEVFSKQRRRHEEQEQFLVLLGELFQGAI